jgi:hypothetical protein
MLTQSFQGYLLLEQRTSFLVWSLVRFQFRLEQIELLAQNAVALPNRFPSSLEKSTPILEETCRQ